MGPREPHEPRLYLKLFLLSVVMLYLELMLIRWISTEIRIFAYFKNLVLIACFLGMSLGCLLAHRRNISFHWIHYFALALCSIVVVPSFFVPNLYGVVSSLLGDFNDLATWSGGFSEGHSVVWRYLAVLVLLVLFGLIALLFVPMGMLLGRLMNQCTNKIAAYSVNIAGSLLGIWLFSAIAYLSFPPPAWFVTSLLLACLLLKGRTPVIIGVLSSAIIGVLLSMHGTPSDNGRTVWSPYQKLVYRSLQLSTDDGHVVPAGYQIRVNNTFYQRAVNHDPNYLSSYPELFPEHENMDYVAYNLVYRLQPRRDNVLVIGAGTGNDVAAALRNGALHVDAVEIDPRIVEIGREIHPERPYADSRVSVIVDDARSFFKKTTRKYDLIVFGALDSHTLNSSLSNIRIDNYVYTIEAFKEARELLTEDGLLCLVFAIERPFIGQRLSGMLRDAFGHEPIVFDNSQVHNLWGAGGGPTFLIDREQTVDQRIRRDSIAEEIISKARLNFPGDVPLGTDDWPYLYLEERGIPMLFMIVMAVIAVLSGITVKPLIGDFRQINAHFFFLGAGFLLVQVQSISLNYS